VFLELDRLLFIYGTILLELQHSFSVSGRTEIFGLLVQDAKLINYKDVIVKLIELQEHPFIFTKHAI